MVRRGVRNGRVRVLSCEAADAEWEEAMKPHITALFGIGAPGVPFGLMYMAGGLAPKASMPWALPTLVAVQLTCLATAAVLAVRVLWRKRA